MSVQIRCSNCDRICEPTDRYCPSCHEPVVSVQAHDAPLDGIELGRWEKFMGPNADKYLRVFKKHQGKSWFRDFHFPAFFVSVEWLIYRKMYWQAAIAWAVAMLSIFGVLLSWRLSPPFTVFFYPLLLIVIKVVFGMFAHAVYKRHCLRQLQKAPESTVKGGTFTAGVIVYVVLNNLFVYFVVEPLVLALALLM